VVTQRHSFSATCSHAAQVLDGDLVVHDGLDLAGAAERAQGLQGLDHGQRARVAAGVDYELVLGHGELPFSKRLLARRAAANRRQEANKAQLAATW